MCNICTLINYNRLRHKILMHFFKLTLYIFCQVIHTISHCVSRKTEGLKKLMVFRTNYFCCIQYTFIPYSSTVNGFILFAIIRQTATFPRTHLVFDLVAMGNILYYHCRSDLRFCNLSSLHFTSRAPKISL